MAEKTDKEQNIEQQAQAAIRTTAKRALKDAIMLLHPITHDFKEFGRGVHYVGAELKSLFLSLVDPVSKQPIAREPKDGDPEAAPLAEAADSPKRLGAPAQRG